MSVLFPTDTHARAADAIVKRFRDAAQVQAILLVNSVARSRATPDSDLDMAILVAPDLPLESKNALEQQWQAFYASDADLQRLRRVGRFTGVHLDIVDGQFAPGIWDDGGGPDSFELEIGNLVAYSLPIWEKGPALARLKRQWLPYYAQELRRQRFEMVRSACLYDLAHVPFYVDRELYFQAFDRLYKSFQEFLQALFISRRTYPLAYNKWIREQVECWLGLPELYRQLPPLLSLAQLESVALNHKAQDLHALVEEWLVVSD
jgi:predicted nucleotidyltransferase